MKKILSFILVAVILLTTIAFSACNVTIDTTTNSKNSTNSTSSTSSTDKADDPPVDVTPETYNISYDCAKGKNSANNPDSYIKGSEFVLEDATLDGYTFTGWVDSSGNRVTGITAEMTGDLELCATWRANRNVSHPISEITNPVYDPYMFFIEGDEYVFIYYLGYIDRVPLDAVGEAFEHNEGTIGTTIEFASSTADSNSIQKSTSKVTENTKGWQSNIELGIEQSVEAGGDCGAVEIKASVKVSAKASHQQSGSSTNIYETGEVTVLSNETVESHKISNVFTEDKAFGYYRYTNFALVDVFAVIAFNPNTNVYSVSNFNSVRDVWQGWDYSAFSGAFDDNMPVDLPFEFPDYLDEQIKGYTDGLKFTTDTDEQGHPVAYVVGYTGTATEIIIPNYYYLEGNETGYPVVGISADAFKNKPITSITLGKHTTIIDKYAFYGCDNLHTVSSKHIESIGEFAFAKCSSLTKITLSDNIHTIDTNAFLECTSLLSIDLAEKNFDLAENSFDGCTNLVLEASPIDNTMLQSVLKSGASIIKIKLTDNAQIENIEALTVPDTIDYIEINGNQAVLNNVHIISKAKETVLLHMTLNYSNNATGVQLYSNNITLFELTVNMNGEGGNAMQLFSESANVTVRGNVSLNGGNGKAESGIGLIANDISISSKASDSMLAKLTVKGGKGADGANGSNASGDGENGTDGHQGSVGSVGFIANNITTDNVTVTVIGGTGGNGGYGGSCNPNLSLTGDKEYGGDGGKGGDGGVAVNAVSIKVNGGSFSAEGGNGGDGGARGGIRGDVNNKYGVRGSYGDGGEGGDALNSDCVIVDEYSALIQTKGNNGDKSTATNGK